MYLINCKAKKDFRHKDENPSPIRKNEYSISRVLYCLCSDNHLSGRAIADTIKRHNPEDQRAASSLPYSVLLRMGFTEPACYQTAGELLPHLSTLTTDVAVSFSMALSLRLPSPDVIWHPALWSSDFPRVPWTRNRLSYLLQFSLS